MTTVPEAFALALSHHQAGNLQQAEQLYLQILQVEPQHVNALHLLGLIVHSAGRHNLAVDYMTRALQLAPHFVEAHSNLGIVLAAQGMFDEAVASYRQALLLRPDYAEAHNNLAIALVATGKLEEAVASYRQALDLRPDIAEVHNNLGIALAALGKPEEAAASYRQSLHLKPDYAEAHNNLGVAIASRGKLEEAIASYHQAICLKPEYAEAHHNLGVALKELGNLHEAVARYQAAIRLKPDYADAHHALGMAWLQMGDFESGWPEYEWRARCKGSGMPSFWQPRWDGYPLAGQTILLHAEQGLGDTLQFIRFAPLVRERGLSVLVLCPESLVRLLASCPGIDRVLTGDSLPRFDVHAPLLSVPGILGTSLATVPSPVPYLHADAELTNHWRHELSKYSTFKIGIAWQGNPRHSNDRNRSFPLVHLAPLAQLEGASLFSLQQGPGTEQLSAVNDRFPVTDLCSKFNNFMDTAAVVQNLDLVITADTAIAHLAGALGVPVWVALPCAPDWRWMLDREDSPWYPSMRLFRQTQWGNWEEVFERMMGEVKTLLEELQARTGSR
jgi:Flp pilus assembly protein TadD